MTKAVKEFLEELIGSCLEKEGKYIQEVSGDHFNDCLFEKIDLCKEALKQLNEQTTLN